MDFGIPADWHFFATVHGKGPCDGVRGTLKRIIASQSAEAIWKANSDAKTIL